MTKVVIFAGGAGTRLSELTEEIPKPMVPIGGEPILIHIMRHFYAAGYNDFVIAVGYMSEKIKRFFVDYQYSDRDVIFCKDSFETRGAPKEDWKVSIVETGEATSTAARLHKVKPYLNNENFFLTYGDCVSDVSLSEVRARHERSKNLVTVTAIPNDERYGLLKVGPNNQVERFSEKTSQISELINGGFMMCSPEILTRVNDKSGDFSYETLTKVAADGKMGYYLHTGFWRPCDTKRDYDALNEIWATTPELFGE